MRRKTKYLVTKATSQGYTQQGRAGASSGPSYQVAVSRTVSITKSQGAVRLPGWVLQWERSSTASLSSSSPAPSSLLYPPLSFPGSPGIKSEGTINLLCEATSGLDLKVHFALGLLLACQEVKRFIVSNKDFCFLPDFLKTKTEVWRNVSSVKYSGHGCNLNRVLYSKLSSGYW